MKKLNDNIIGNAIGLVVLAVICYGMTRYSGTGPNPDKAVPIEEKATVVSVSVFWGEVTVDVYDVNSYFDYNKLQPYEDGNTKLNCRWMKKRWSVLADLQPGDSVVFTHKPLHPYRVVSMRVLE